MKTETGKLEKTENGINVVYENGSVMLTVTGLTTKNLPAPHLNIAKGRGKKPKGKKEYGFIVKTDGTVLAII